MWVARESSCVLRTGDAQAAHSRKTGDETGRALRLPGHEALERNPCCPCAVTGSSTRLGGPSSNTDDVQKIQSCNPEQSQMAPGVTRGFKLLFSWTAVISLYREQGVMDMAFMSECLLTLLLLLLPATEESLSHCCSNTPAMVLLAAATPKSPLIYFLGKSTQPPKAISSQQLSILSACALWRHCWDTFLSWVTACSRLLHRKREEMHQFLPYAKSSHSCLLSHPSHLGITLKTVTEASMKLGPGPPIWACQFKKKQRWASEIYKFPPNFSGFQN